MKSPLDKAQLKPFIEPQNGRPLLDLLLRFAGELLCFALAFAAWQHQAWLAAGIFFYVGAVWHGFCPYLAHELSHGRVFTSPLVNRVLFALVSYWTWTNPAFFADTHKFHHQNTFDPADSEGHSLQDWRFLPILAYLTVDLAALWRRLFYVLCNGAGFYPQKQGQNIVLRRLDWRFRQHALGILLLQLVVHGLIFWCFADVWLNLAWLARSFVGTFFHRLTAQSQHIGLQHFAKQGALKHSRTLRLPKLWEFLYASMNYHAEHHLYPYIPYYHLHAVHALLREQGAIVAVDWRAFFFRDIWRLIREQRAGLNQ